jgi:scyllo-inositol 2-dehydrogenase (NADP+)
MLTSALTTIGLLASITAGSAVQTPPPLRLAIAGLVHGHVGGFLRGAQGRQDVQIVGVFDPDRTLLEGYATQYKLPESVLFTDLSAMLAKTNPEAVASFTNTADHPMVVEAAASRRIHVMMEKPLALGNADAQRIKRAAERGGIQVLVNFETTWYPSHGSMWPLIKERGELGEIRKMVAMDGHSGPKAIKVQAEFLDWLRDPVRNGAGALYDFGCYGANLMTWMMDNQRPVAVTATTQQFQPETYPKVDDEATILVEYPKAQGIIQASWNWPFNRKDFEVYGQRGWAIATGGNSLRVALPGQPDHAVTPDPRPPDQKDSIAHLLAVVRGTVRPNALSSLENNLIATEILDAARESARTRQRVVLAR